MVCYNADRRRIIEHGWNGGMAAGTMARLFEGISPEAITKHIKKHADGDGNRRNLDVPPELPARDRVLLLQYMQLEEFERRIEVAKTKADQMNHEREKLVDANGDKFPPVDWSDFFDILSPRAQAAIGSIIKTQGLSDKRETVQGALKLGLFEAMANAGLSPKRLIGGGESLQLGEGDEQAD